MLLKFYIKDGYFHLKKLDESEHRQLLEMSRNYNDIVEAFIRQTSSVENVERYREAMAIYKEKYTIIEKVGEY